LKELFHEPVVVTVIGLIAGVLTSLSMLPQLLKTIRLKQAGDVSPAMLIVLICGVAIWVFYGVIRNDVPIILTNSFSFLLNVSMLYFQRRYKNR
jgi:MtN3 and saliva related transmembrane protein